MSFGNTSGFLKGVPMKLNDKFRPLPKVETFYDVPILFPESVLDDEIDLTVENRAIKDFLLAQEEIHLKSLLPDRRSSLNGAGGVDGAEAQNSVETKVANDCSVVNKMPNRTYSTTPSKYQAVLQPSHYLNGITSPLQPVPVGSNNFDSPSSVNNTSSSPTHNKLLKNNLLKLEDFEACQSSPFDAVELKTLNVFEELRQVLQGHHANGHQSVVVSSDQQTQSTPSSSINGHRHIVHNLQ